MKKSVGVAAALMVWLSPEFAVLLFLLFVFWENLGDLTLKVYDDHQLMKTEKALKGNVYANVEGYYVHMLTMRSVAERERRSRARTARRRMVKTARRAMAYASLYVSKLAHGWQRPPLDAATEEE